LAALRAGKHVHVEKPMAHTIDEARVMTRVARETGLVTQMGNWTHGSWRTLRDQRPDVLVATRTASSSNGASHSRLIAG
jgi:predicted dehydrogenase